MSVTRVYEGGPAALSLFEGLRHQPEDALLGLIALHRADSRPAKIDVGLGVYRNESGATPVMRSVKAAEERLVRDQETKSYLGAEGDSRFTDLLADVVFGGAIADSDRLTGVQTPGGTGALRLGAELIARGLPGATVWMGAPTWPNHAPIFEAAGLRVRSHRFIDVVTGTIDFSAMEADLAQAKSQDVLLLHGCCHNPTGAALSADQWSVLVQLLVRTGVVPFVDLAYQGLGDGLERDAEPTRILLRSVPEALVAYSCDKNFGLYRERVGAFWVQAATRASATLARGNVLALARGLWSMPPDHGAAIVRTILEDQALSDDWRAELDAMRLRINALRLALAEAHPALAPIADQRGLFAMLPISTTDVVALRESHGIYMAGNGRMNIAGLVPSTVSAFVAAVAPFLPTNRGT